MRHLSVHVRQEDHGCATKSVAQTCHGVSQLELAPFRRQRGPGVAPFRSYIIGALSTHVHVVFDRDSHNLCMQRVLKKRLAAVILVPQSMFHAAD